MKRFQMIDTEFICENCHRKVPKLNYTARDHCPYCLVGKHVDLNPGDRQVSCHGLLRPIEVIKHHKAGFQIVFKCDRCGMIKKNIIAQDDNWDLIVTIMKNKKS